MDLHPHWTCRPVVWVVSVYLCAVGIWLLFTGQIRIPGAWKVVMSLFRKRFIGSLAILQKDDGFCWRASLPNYLPSDTDSRSRLVLFEDGRPLGPAHAPHVDIRRLGAGRYSHWGSELYFSASDNSDPRSSGRVYHVEE